MSHDRAQIADGSILAQSQFELALSFVLRPAFTRKYSPATLTEAPAFVDAILATINTDLGVNLSSQRDALINAFDQAGGSMAGRGAVLYRLAEVSITNPINNTPFVTAEDTRSFASAFYNGYLKRDGSIAELNSLLAQLPGGSDRRGFIDQFVSLSDYRLRFGPANAQASVIVSGRVVTPSGERCSAGRHDEFVWIVLFLECSERSELYRLDSFKTIPICSADHLSQRRCKSG